MSHYLLATDADWIVEQVGAALDGPDVRWTVARVGRSVRNAVARAVADGNPPDLAILDLQIGTMGGVAVCLDLRLEESAGRLPHVPVLMLLDRSADVFLAQRPGAEGWLIKPLDAIRLRRAVRTILAGGTVQEGVPESQQVALG
ncbi:MAG TPA: response regulator [Acidimicrobiales bacterium]